MAVFLPTAFLGGITGQLVPPVRPDHRRHRAHQRRQRPDAQAGPVRLLAAARCPKKGAVQPRCSTPSTGRSSGLRLARAATAEGLVADADSLRRRRGVHILVVQRTPPTGFLPDRGPGLRVDLPCSCPTPRRSTGRGEVEQRLNAMLRERRGRWLVRPRRVLAARRHEPHPNAATAFIFLEGLEGAEDAGAAAGGAGRQAAAGVAQMREARIIVLIPPAIQGLGFAGGIPDAG
jgi:hypothetical protein